jgi:hypothetical protein
MASNPFEYRPLGLGAAILQGQEIARSRAMQDQERAAREQAMRMREAEEAYAAQSRPLQLRGEQLALRGQMLGTIETPEDYARVLPAVQELGLPTTDLPAGNQSTAWLQFRKPTEATTAPAWMPAQFRQPDLSPVQQGQRVAQPMATGAMEAPGIAPEDVASVQRAAERGLPLQMQAKMRDADIGRQMQIANLERNRQKDALSQSWMDFQREAKTQGMTEAEKQREFTRMMQERGFGLDLARFDLTKKEAERSAALGPRFTADQTNAATYGRRVEQGISDLDRMDQAGYDPTTLLNSAKLSALVTGTTGANLVASPQEKQTAQAYRNIINAVLRRESGAAIASSEFANAQQQYFPAVNDDPATRAQKRRNLEQALEGLRVGAGPAWEATKRVSGPAKGAGDTKPTASPYKFTKAYQGATYGRNSEGEQWKLVK